MSHAQILNTPIRNLILDECGTVLDVGCGYGEFGFMVKVRKNCDFLIGIDVWKPHLDRLEKLKVRVLCDIVVVQVFCMHVLDKNIIGT